MKKNLILLLIISTNLLAYPQMENEKIESNLKRDFFNEGKQAFQDNKYEKSREIWQNLCENKKEMVLLAQIWAIYMITDLDLKKIK